MDNPLVDLSKLSEPVTKLVEVVSAGIGSLYAPFGTVRQAKADAKAKIILANADVEVASIQQRAHARMEYREALRQENIEKIVCQASLELPESVSKDPVDTDWVLLFFDNAQDVCDNDMQLLWARVLAGEVSSPGSYTKRTLQFLKTMDKWEAESFTKYCSLCFSLEGGWKFISEDTVTKSYLKKMAGDFGFSEHFNGIGLVGIESLLTPSDVNEKKIHYFEHALQLFSLEKKPEKSVLTKLELPFAFRFLTQTGQELSKIAGATPIEDYLIDVRRHFESENKVAMNDIP